MSYETESFVDIVRLTTQSGKVPKEIPAHYWRFCWAMRRAAMGNKTPSVDWRNVARRDKPICLPYIGA